MSKKVLVGLSLLLLAACNTAADVTTDEEMNNDIDDLMDTYDSSSADAMMDASSSADAMMDAGLDAEIDVGDASSSSSSSSSEASSL